MFAAIGSKIGNFIDCRSGEGAMQMAIFFGAFALLVALVGAPALDKASKSYAENRALGIDRVITGSIGKNDRYTVRKSILDETSKED